MGFFKSVWRGITGAIGSVVNAISNVIGGAIDVVADVTSKIPIVGKITDDILGLDPNGGGITKELTTLGTMAATWYIGGQVSNLVSGSGSTLFGGAGGGASAFGADAVLAGEAGVAASEAVAASSPWGLNPGPSISEFGTFNPAITSAPGISASAGAGAGGYLGGLSGLAPGVAGLTAEQLAQAAQMGQVGSNAASGLGYLGGAEALPAGSAGIEGVVSNGAFSPRNIKRAIDVVDRVLNPNQAQQAGQVGQPGTARPATMMDQLAAFNPLALSAFGALNKKEETPASTYLPINSFMQKGSYA